MSSLSLFIIIVGKYCLDNSSYRVSCMVCTPKMPLYQSPGTTLQPELNTEFKDFLVPT